MELKDITKSINQKQDFYGPEFENEMNGVISPFVLLKIYSFHEEFISLANDLNKSELTAYELYIVLFDLIPKKRSYFKPWLKAEKEKYPYGPNEINLLIRILGCGYKDAVSYLNNLLTEDEINQLKEV